MKLIKNISLIFLMLLLCNTDLFAQTPLRLAVAGTTHGHVGWILGRKDKQYNIPEELFFDDLKTMLDKVRPQAVVAFGSIYQHLSVVESCAPRGIHVMV